MSSPFPGMDPYLESPSFWAEMHNRMIVVIADDLSPKLRPHYRVAIEQRIYLSSPGESQPIVPDVTITQRSTIRSSTATIAQPITQPITIALALPEEVRESYLEVREISTGRVITVLKLLSPKNKRNGEGRSADERKRQQILASVTHFVEIDLFRRGQAFPLGEASLTTPYCVLVAGGDRRSNADLFAFSLRETMPSFPMPLANNSIEQIVPLQEIFNGVYDRAGFDLAIDYRQSIPEPALSDDDISWAKELIDQP